MIGPCVAGSPLFGLLITEPVSVVAEVMGPPGGVGWVDEWEKGIRSERGRWQLSSAHLWRTLIMGLVFCLERDREGRIPPPRLLFCTPSGYGTISTGFETHLLKMLLV